VGDRVADLRGLASRKPFLAWATVLMLVSLIGVPPLAGFAGKLFLFTAAMGAGLVPLAVLAVVMSAVSAGFYFRIVRAMFFEPVAEGAPAIAANTVGAWVVGACVFATVAIGVASGPLLAAIRFSIH
jgi:NADH-quinone oxidoreductase subunit N